MINFPSQAITSDLDPLIITSPVMRSGTTLLQRLLCSSPQALIYGEMCAQDLEFFLNIYAFKVQAYTMRKPTYALGLQRVLAGDVTEWIPDLMPDVDAYLEAIGRSAFAGIAYCRNYALQAGRPVWGFKYPGWKPAMIRLLRTMIPKARFIFIQRNLEDCLRSAKAQEAVPSYQEVREFCQSWADNLAFMLSLADDPAVLLLRYEDLVRAPTGVLGQLARFTGLADVNPNVLSRKVNAWAGEVTGIPASDGYTRPAELNETEMEIVRATTFAFKEQLFHTQNGEAVGV